MQWARAVTDCLSNAFPFLLLFCSLFSCLEFFSGEAFFDFFESIWLLKVGASAESLEMLVLLIVGILVVLTSGSSDRYQCSMAEKLFQFDNFELVGLHICDPETVWRMAQLSIPDAKMVLDVGGNLGYTAARLFGLWSPGHGFNRASLKRAIVAAIRSNQTTNRDQTSTYCRDGAHADVPFLCVGQPVESNLCRSRKNLHVISFDGQLEHVTNQRRIIYESFPQLHPNASYDADVSQAKATWEYVHAAVTDNKLAAKRQAYFRVHKQELGELVFEIPEKSENTYLPVQVLSVDKFCWERGLSTVDILKVDTEGHDAAVIRGAEETLRTRNVKMLTFECTECVDKSWGEIFDFLDELGFDCYLHGMFSLTVRMTGCWPYNLKLRLPAACQLGGRCPTYMRSNAGDWTRYALDSNAYCAHRTRAPTLAALLDQMSLHRYTPQEAPTATPPTVSPTFSSASSPRGHFHKDAMLSVVSRDVRMDYVTGKWNLEPRGLRAYTSIYGRDARTGAKIFWSQFNGSSVSWEGA